MIPQSKFEVDVGTTLCRKINHLAQSTKSKTKIKKNDNEYKFVCGRAEWVFDNAKAVPIGYGFH